MMMNDEIIDNERQQERYTDELRLDADRTPSRQNNNICNKNDEGQWTRVVNHRFTKELAAGTIDIENVLVPYLVQDHRFLDSFSILLASTIASLPTLSQRIPLCQFLAVITGPENTYFERAFDELGVSPAERTQIPDADVTTKFCNLMREVAIGIPTSRSSSAAAGGGGDGGDYSQHPVNICGSTLAEKLAVLVVCEWSYLSWGRLVQHQTVRERFVCYEWVDLHSGPEFESIVDYLRKLLDEEGRRLKEEGNLEGLQACQRRFLQTVNLEEEFFEYAYSHKHQPS